MHMKILLSVPMLCNMFHLTGEMVLVPEVSPSEHVRLSGMEEIEILLSDTMLVMDDLFLMGMIISSSDQIRDTE